MRSEVGLVALVACASAGDDVEFALSGPLDPAVDLSGAAPVIVWVQLGDGLGAAVVPAQGEGGDGAWWVDVAPAPTHLAVEPSGLVVTGATLRVGIVAWVDDPEGVTVDARRVAGWLVGDERDLDGIEVDGAPPLAVTRGHAVVSAQVEGGGRVSGAAGWTAEGPACRFDGAVGGTTLYRDTGRGCLGWDPLAAPGTRDAFQGIPAAPL